MSPEKAGDEYNVEANQSRAKKYKPTVQLKFSKKTFFMLGIIIAIGLIGLFTMKRIHSSIRTSQIDEVVATDINSKQLHMIAFDELDQLLQTKTAVSILFIAPNAPNYQTVLQMIQKKENELNRMIYVYPIIYQSQEIERRYDLSSTEATFVFFQKGELKKRFTFESLKKPQKELIPEMNRLPMWNITDKKNP